MTEPHHLKAVIEGLIFASGSGLSLAEIAAGLGVKAEEAKIALDSLIDDYREREGGIFIQEVSGKYQFATDPKVYAPIQNFLRYKKKETLSKSMLETLAIITYKQPITLPEIEEIRNASSRAQLIALQQKKLVKVIGHRETPGRPALYGTTKEFLRYFGLNSLDELPPPQDVKQLNFDEL
ncbi:MAG: SMC-Scp complex subunit ScpB [Turneriella sp.]|nr:SMC-Scp complex subunit ScpB [Leptospiraceae bacterium]MCX7633655.1 SMC-Scp complex subunit ScpB [Turneriella sp.]